VHILLHVPLLLTDACVDDVGGLFGDDKIDCFIITLIIYYTLKFNNRTV